MSTPHPSEETIAAFALGKLDEPASAEVAAHLDQCPECRAAAVAVTADGFVGHLRAAFGADAIPPTDPNRTVDTPGGAVGQEIAGRYKLLQPIGEGGMGSVWMAEQREPVKRKVAVKLIRTDRGGGTMLARFEAERQALAGC